MTPKSDAPGKKKRSRRACDNCRARKIKCDGLDPCVACSAAERECIYGNRDRPHVSLAVYVTELEKRNDDLENALRAALTNQKPDPVGSTAMPPLQHQDSGTCLDWSDDESTAATAATDPGVLDTMIKAAGRLRFDQQGNCSYSGHFAGFDVLQDIAESCDRMLLQGPDMSNSQRSSLLSSIFDGPDLLAFDPNSIPSRPVPLPSKLTAQQLAKITFNDACCLISFVHEPTFEKLLDRVYDRSEDYYTSEDRAFLHCLYEVMAIGELFLADRDGLNQKMHRDKSLAYFHAGQIGLDKVGCGEVISLQAMMFVIMYLQSAGRISACHSYLALAVAAAMRLGIHRSVSTPQFGPVEVETRKRVFWALQTMDTYVATILGFPKNLGDESIDQDLPLEICDKDITIAGVHADPSAQSSKMTLVNAHSKLMSTQTKISNQLFSVKNGSRDKQGFLQVDTAKITEVENDLTKWFTELPASEPHQHYPSNYIRTQLLLRMAYAHVQMVLYRPFLHHINRMNPTITADLRSFACASACVKAAMQVIWLVEQLDNQGLLTGSYWLTVYMTFFASIILVMFALGNTRDPTVMDSLNAAAKGQIILRRLSCNSHVAAGCATKIQELLNRMPRASVSTASVTDGLCSTPVVMPPDFENIETDSNMPLYCSQELNLTDWASDEFPTGPEQLFLLR